MQAQVTAPTGAKMSTEQAREENAYTLGVQAPLKRGFPPSERDSPTQKTPEDKRGRIDEHQSSTEGEMGEDEMDVSAYPTGV
jgi:hypothetical protein